MIVAKWTMNGIMKADAQKCYEEIRAIGDDVRPEQVLDIAKREDTELHKCFTWDDSVAAEKYRIIQAQRVLKLLVIKEEKKPKDRPEIRLFYKTENHQGYKPTTTIVRKEDEYKALLERAYAELRAFKAKYSMITELREIFDLIDETQNSTD